MPTLPWNAVRIIHQDRHLLVIEKPAGMPSVSLRKGQSQTLAAWLVHHFPEQAAFGGEKEAGLVQRLDNDTSGLILAARTPSAYEALRTQLNKDAIHKEYMALVLGSPPPAGRITYPIAHHPRKKKKMTVCQSLTQAKTLEARPAKTSFKVVKRFCMPQKKTRPMSTFYTLLRVIIKKGVRHQIRAHLAALGFPLAGDRLYQNPHKKSQDRLLLARHFLHASRLRFAHPQTAVPLDIESDLPQDLKEALSRLKCLGD